MVGDVGIIAVAVMRLKKLQGLTSPTSYRRKKYRLKQCNGDAIGRKKLESIVKQFEKEFKNIAVGAPVIKRTNARRLF